MFRILLRKKDRLGRQLFLLVRRDPKTLASEHLEDVRHLLDAGADVNYADGHECVLGRAARAPWGMAGVVRLLLEYGADVNGPGGEHIIAPIIQGAHQSDSYRLRLLIDAGAELSTVDKWSGRSVLVELTPWASPNLIEYVLIRGADPNVGNFNNGYKPLHMAALCGRDDLIELYIRYGADVIVGDQDGCTPLQLAANEGKHERISSVPPEQYDATMKLLTAAGGDR